MIYLIYLLYLTLSENQNLDIVYRDLATILGAFAELETNTQSTVLIERANLLATGTSSLRFSAKEVAALKAFMDGNKQKAHTYYEEISKEAAAPQELRNRAQDMLNILAN